LGESGSGTNGGKKKRPVKRRVCKGGKCDTITSDGNREGTNSRVFKNWQIVGNDELAIEKTSEGEKVDHQNRGCFQVEEKKNEVQKDDTKHREKGGSGKKTGESKCREKGVYQP